MHTDALDNGAAARRVARELVPRQCSARFPQDCLKRARSVSMRRVLTLDPTLLPAFGRRCIDPDCMQRAEDNGT